ncbi:MAG TPA: CPBP family intramembrane glutamic endopeptidase [Acidimicrobiia bacterium]|jgi:membrane protease YdiL (CAAX protease family)|nr:CPBP family intramembrane glutamic endopeptidase [Acidimicrobiia bacterium]
MTLAAVVAPLAAYAVFFQTLIYLSLPSRLRTRIAPVLNGAVGASVAVGGGIIFGFASLGLVGGDLGTALAWGAATVMAMSLAGTVLMRWPDSRRRLADPRLVDLGRAEAFGHIFFRIPVFTALIEEAFFRGVLHAALIAVYPVDVAVWIGAGLFGLWHIGPGLDQAKAGDKAGAAGAAHTAATVVATSVAGAFLVWLRIETGSIWAPVAVHASINMTMAVFARMAARRD